MKTFINLKRSIMMAVLAALIVVFSGGTAFSQETPKKESKATVKLKIIKEKNGKTTVIDTTFSPGDGPNQEEVKKIIAEIESDMEESGNDLYEMQYDMAYKMFDSAMKDSLHKCMNKVIVLDKDRNCPGLIHYYSGGDFDYDFKLPCLPDCPMIHSEYEDQETDILPYHGRAMWRKAGRGESLSDMLGDIPMDRVINYSVKDRKGGKRIVIDIADSPFPDREERFIYLNEPKVKCQKSYKKPGEVKVIIRSDKDTPGEPAKPE